MVNTKVDKNITEKNVLPVNSRKPSYHLSTLDIWKIIRVSEYIRDNLEDPLPSLKELAKSFGTNDYKLKYGFKRLYGATVFNYLTSERLTKAQIFVKHSNIPIKEVARMTGFKCPSHFSRTFKKKYGYTPRDLRKQAKG